MEGLITKDLSIGYDTVLVSGIEIKLIPGRILTLIGPNGSGKSTLLKTIAGELKKKGGEIKVYDRDVFESPAREIAKLTAMVSTERVRPEYMTCEEVVETGRYPYTGITGILSEEDKAIVLSAMESLNVSKIKDKFFTKVSDGQKQRVLLARAIAQTPKVLILDEPTSYLDIRHKIDILERIKKLSHEEGVSVIMSLHELDIAMRISDDVICVGEGKILRYGKTNEVFEENFIRKLYGIENADISLLGGVPWLQ